MAEMELPDCFGPYLRYAIDSDFANFSTDFEDFGKKFRFFDEDRFRLLLLVELKQAEFVRDFEGAMGAREEFGTEFGPDVGNTRYATMRCHKAAVTDQHGAFPIWTQYVSRVELSLPVRPSSPGTRNRKAALVERYDEGKDSPGSLLIGMLDDGCPFAAAHFLNILSAGGVSTRVRGIWDQNQEKQPVTISGRDFGMELTDFGYGLEYRRDFASLLAPGKIGLDDWIGLHSTPQNSIDEDHCYAEAEFTRLKFRESHGAHVMDVLAGRIPTSSRIGPPGDRRDPPSWRPGTDAASSAEVVFVQFSEDNIRDATGVWLPTYVVQGIQYVLSFAKPNVTERVIINLSYGPTTGPHDGTALLEEALTALVAYYDGTSGKPELEIFLAAGNSYLTEGHVVFRRHNHNQPDHGEWIWRLPPDNTVLCFCEVWMKTVHAGSVSVTLTSPSGQPLGVDGPIAFSSDDTMWLLRVKPTIASTGLVAEHGDYTISVAGVPHHLDADVHAYVARSDPNMGVRTGAKLSHFVDPEWERTRSAEASCKYDNGEFDKTGSLIDRYGTLNGIATAKDDRVHVAGGYIIANQRKSTYSSAGPARPDSLRVGPDYLLPCDESYALQGIRAGGTRSGTVFRLIGTSTAAPQLARHVADPPIPPAHDIPSPGIEQYKRGGGNLDPP